MMPTPSVQFVDVVLAVARSGDEEAWCKAAARKLRVRRDDIREVRLRKVKPMAPPFHRHIARAKLTGRTCRVGDRVVVFEIVETDPAGECQGHIRHGEVGAEVAFALRHVPLGAQHGDGHLTDIPVRLVA